MATQRPRYIIKFTRAPEKTLARLPKNLRDRLRQAIDRLADNPRPHDYKQLAGEQRRYRIRVGDWRIVYRIHDNVLVVIVVKVASRGEAYRGLSEPAFRQLVTRR